MLQNEIKKVPDRVPDSSMFASSESRNKTCDDELENQK